MHDHTHAHGSGTDRFSDEAAGWDEKPGHAERARDVADRIRATVPLRPDMAVLEIGGGTGLLSRNLADEIGTATVTDVAPGMVAAARAALDDPRYAGWQAYRLDIEHDDVPAERYDLVLGLLALHHMDDVATVVARCASLLRPGGRVALVDLDHDPDGAFHAHVHDFDGHHGFTREDVAGWLSAAGLTDVELADAGTVTKDDGAGQQRDFPMFLATGLRP
jgi:2-polyprenyl-3-methyl-5-hydroxy-6-metoxy-1,4-benzoquinol methylase